MTTTKSNILLPYLEDTGLDGKKLCTPKEWTERLRHYIKRIHDVDIKPALSGDPDTINTKRLIQLFKDYYMPKQIPSTAEETSSGQNKKKTKHRKNTGEN